MKEYWLSVVVSWTPFFFLIVTWVVLTRFNRPRGPSGATMIEIREQQLVEMRRTNVALERIAAALDKRSQG
jgi:hypothetical protein